MYRIAIIVMTIATLTACGSVAPTGAGGAASATASASATGGAGGMTATSTGTGGPVDEDFSPPACDSVFESLVAEDNDIPLERLPVPPVRPYVMATAKFRIYVGPPCLGADFNGIVYKGGISPNATPTADAYRVVPVKLSDLTWSHPKTSNGFADVVIKLDPPLTLDVGEYPYAGPRLSKGMCAIGCADLAVGDKYAYFTSYPVGGMPSVCPEEQCSFQSANAVTMMKVSWPWGGTGHPESSPRILPPDGGVVCPDGSKPPCPVLTGYDSQ